MEITSVNRNQGDRDCNTLAEIGNEVLIEYFMPNGTTALNIIRANGSYKTVSYNHVPKKWLKAIVDAGSEWGGHPQGRRGRAVASAKEMLKQYKGEGVTLGLIHFDEKGVVKTDEIRITKEQLGINCWLPERFLGGTCDRYYICKYAEKAGCKAEASKLARQKVESGETPAGKVVRKSVFCAACEEFIDDSHHGGDGPFYGDEGTMYANQPLCETCYYEDEPCATVYYRDSEEPKIISATRNETEGDFTVEYHRTDAWRGYYELRSDQYTEIFSDAILSGHESEEMLKKLNDLMMQRFNEEKIEFARGFCRSSNVFFTSLEVWVRKDLEQLMRAHLIIAELKQVVDFDNPVYSTGILFPRENLEKFKKLLGKRYEIKQDSDIADLVARKGPELLDEIREAAQVKQLLDSW